MENKISITPFVKKRFHMPPLWHKSESMANLQTNSICRAIVVDFFTEVKMTSYNLKKSMVLWHKKKGIQARMRCMYSLLFGNMRRLRLALAAHTGLLIVYCLYDGDCAPYCCLYAPVGLGGCTVNCHASDWDRIRGWRGGGLRWLFRSGRR